MTDSEPLDLTQYQDIHGAAATNVLAARDFYTVESSTSVSKPRLVADVRPRRRRN